jgi:hypothetical protein
MGLGRELPSEPLISDLCRFSSSGSLFYIDPLISVYVLVFLKLRTDVLPRSAPTLVGIDAPE